MKTAVVFYSMHGNVRYVSEKVAKELGADLIELIPVKAYPDKGAMQFIWGGSAVTFKKKPELEPYTFNASDYDLVIIGTPPKEKPSDENEKQIAAFIDTCKGL